MYIIITLIVLVLVGVFIFNKFVRYKMLVREAWSGIDVQLKRRYNLIPQIVEVVKGYRDYEQKLLEDVTKLRSEGINATAIKEKGAVENKLSQSLKSIFAVAENYPELKANQNFLELQKTLSLVEDQIQLARRYYNGTVRNYNILAESFPSNLLALFFKFKPFDYFEIEYATERKIPDVKL